jgi:hypothetical protein
MEARPRRTDARMPVSASHKKATAEHVGAWGCFRPSLPIPISTRRRLNLSHRLLGPGLRGVMVAGILAANMSTLDAVCVYLSALFVRHLYKPFVADKSQRHYVMVSRAAIAGFLLLGIYVSVSTASIIHLIKALLAEHYFRRADSADFVLEASDAQSRLCTGHCLRSRDGRSAVAAARFDRRPPVGAAHAANP